MQKQCAMPHQTCKSQLNVFSTLIFHHAVAFLLLTHSHGGQAQTMLATVGDDVTLPCHVRPATDAVNQMLEWSRPDLNPRFVHVRRSGEVRLVDQNPSYKGRTSVSIVGLKQGDASLTLSKVRVTDEGTYRCFVPGLKTESNVQLVVVSGTIIEITKVSSGVLQCESRGWFPEPEVLWLDGEGNLLSAGPTETVRGPDHLYTVSSRVTVEKRHSNSFTCRVQQRTINQTRETHITVPDDLFSGSSGSGSSSSASTIIGLVVGFMFILAVAFVLWKWRKNKNKKVEHHVDEETQRRGEKKSNSIINDSEQEFLIERESDNREKLTAERPMMKNQDKMKDKHHIDCLSEGTGRSCQNEKETHQEKAGGGTYQIVTHIKKDRTEVETGKDLDDTEEETPAPRPEQRDTHKEEPEDTYTDTAAQGREELKPAGQAPTDEKKDELEETGGQTGKSDATPCPTEGEGQHEKNTVEREMMKNSSRSEGTGCSYQNRKETHQEKAGGETNPIVTHIKKDRTEEETRLNLDDTDEETKSMNEETAAPRPEEKNSHQEEPEDTKPLNTETAVQGQMDSDGQQQLLGEEGGIKPAGQGLTGGENDELEETGGQKGESDATPCPTEGEGQHEKNTEKRDGALSLAEGRTDQLPEVLNGLNQKDDDGKTEPNKEPAGQNAIEEETQRNEIQPGGVIKPAGQGPTDGEKNELEQTLGKTGNSDATPEIDSAPSLADGQTYQLPKALNDVNKNNEDTKKESTNNEPAGQDARPRQTRRDELQTEGEKDTEEDNNVVTNDTEPLCSLKTETHTEQPEKSHDSRDGENGMKLINDDIRQTDKPPAGEKEVENAEEEKETEKTGLSCETARETNGDAQNRKEQGNRKSGREASD